MFTVESLTSNAVLVFGKERLVTVLRNSPMHDAEVAVIELYTAKASYEGALCLRDLIQFAGIINLDTSDIFIREQSECTIELWLFKSKLGTQFDDDPTPVNHIV